MSGNSILGLMKVGRAEDMERLHKHGEIYMKDIAYFRKLEADMQRGDASEGISALSQVTWVKIKIDEDQFIEFSKDSEVNRLADAKLRTYYDEDNGNIYCMYAFTSDLCKKTNVVDPLVYDFGDSFVLFLNVAELINRFEKALKKKRIKMYKGLVNYYDDKKDHKDLDVFDKPNTFEHQSEFRIFIKRRSTKPYKFNIGPLDDISVLYHIDELKKMSFGIDPNTGQFMYAFYEEPIKDNLKVHPYK